MSVIRTTSDSLAVDVTQAGMVWRRFKRHRSGLMGLAVLSLVVLSVIILPFFSPFDISQTNGAVYLQPIGASHESEGNIPHLLGTNRDGRDFFTMLFIGGRSTLLVALIPTIAIAIIGTLLGGIAGYFGGMVDNVIMRVTDFLSALPLLPAYVFMFRILAPTRDSDIEPSKIPILIGTVALVFVLFGWMGICRMVRAQVLSLRVLPFVEAARALGAGHPRIIRKHLLPNAAAPVIVASTAAFGEFVVMEAVITFFGLGLRMPPLPSWGNLISEAQSYAWSLTNLNPWQDIRPLLLFAPILFVMITVFAINYIGDALRDALDPHVRGR